MTHSSDTERTGKYEPIPHSDAEEQEALLRSQEVDVEQQGPARHAVGARFTFFHLVLAFFAGILLSSCTTAIFPALCSPFRSLSSSSDEVRVAAPSHVGSTERHNYPPASPTNGDISYFPTDVGYAGKTPTGAEPAVIATAPSYPIHSGAPVLVKPSTKEELNGSKNSGFDIFKYWGNLSPWYSIERGTFGVDSGPEAPEQCAITGLHFLHRHGARYPTAWG